MDVVPVGESILQGEFNRLCSHRARGRVNNDSLERMISPVYVPSRRSLEVDLNRREELEHRHIKVMLIDVRILRQEPEAVKIRMKRVARGRTAGFKLVWFVDIHISSIGDLSAPVITTVLIRTLPGGHEVLQSSHTLGKICTIFERKKADILLVPQR